MRDPKARRARQPSAWGQKTAAKALLRGFGGCQPLASRGFGR